MSVSELSEVFLLLQEQGCHNINLVTPSHYVPEIVQALGQAAVKIPVVYNTSSYECVQTLQKMEGLVDIYLADLKYLSPTLAKKYSHAANYPETAKSAIAEMVRQAGAAEYVYGTENGRETVVKNATEYPDGALMRRGGNCTAIAFAGADKGGKTGVAVFVRNLWRYDCNQYFKSIHTAIPCGGIPGAKPPCGGGVRGSGRVCPCAWYRSWFFAGGAGGG